MLQIYDFSQLKSNTHENKSAIYGRPQRNTDKAFWAYTQTYDVIE
jgi:hypothetical protein